MQNDNINPQQPHRDAYSADALQQMPLEALGDLAHQAQEIFDSRHEALMAKRSKPPAKLPKGAKGKGKAKAEDVEDLEPEEDEEDAAAQ